jgi:hypothetical protein
VADLLPLADEATVLLGNADFGRDDDRAALGDPRRRLVGSDTARDAVTDKSICAGAEDGRSVLELPPLPLPLAVRTGLRTFAANDLSP